MSLGLNTSFCDLENYKNHRAETKVKSIIFFTRLLNDMPMELADIGTKLVSVIPGKVLISRKERVIIIINSKVNSRIMTTSKFFVNLNRKFF